MRVLDKEKAEEDPAVRAELRALSEKLGEEGRVLLRASGTEPLIRVMAEAKTEEECEDCVNRLIAVMERSGLTI